jgi:thermitase
MLIVAIVAVVGLPGVQQFAPPPVEAQPAMQATRDPMPPGDVWTGNVPSAAPGAAVENPLPPAAPAEARTGTGIDTSSVGSSSGATDTSSVSSRGAGSAPAVTATPASASQTAASSTASSASTAASTPTSTAGTEPLIVRFKSGSGRTGQVDAHVRAGAIRARAAALTDTVVVDVPSGRGTSALAAYNARPDVLYAEPDYTVHAFYSPNDPQYPSQYALPKVGAPAAWDVTRGTSAVRVAIVDCGVFSQQTGRLHSDGVAGHPDLRSRVIANQDFTGSSTGFDDYCDHGTHVAGIIGAAGNNGVGVSGVAPEVSLMNAKVLDDSGSGQTSDILAGVQWAVQNGAHVVNMSLGRDGACSQSEADMMTYAWNQGVVVIAAAGNSSLGASGAPGNCANVVSVASTTSADVLSSFSNYGTGVDVAAPGSAILSTVRSGGYASFNGTSMASPLVAGIAGLIFSVNPSRTPQSVVDAISTTAVAISGTGSQFAWGRINAAAAVGNGGGTPAPNPTAVPTATSAPIPTPVSCPSPRKPITVSTSLASGHNLDGMMQAGTGVIRRVDFTQFTNASITVSGNTGATQPFSILPSPPVSQIAFKVTQLSADQPGVVKMRIHDDCGPWETFAGGGVSGFQRGYVSGIVRNSATGQPIPNANVVVRGTSRTAITSSSGGYTISDVPVGARTVDIGAPGFVNQSFQTTVYGDQTAAVYANLSPPVVQANVGVTLTWGASPRDLDIHLSGPAAGGGRFHLYWDNQNAASHAVLSGDAHDGFGPEAVTIQRTSSGTWVPGEYRIWSHNFSGTPGYSGSSAKATVTRGGTTLGTYNVSSATGTSTLPLWRSVNLTIDAGGNVSLAATQQFVAGSGTTLLRFQDGDEDLSWPTTKP